MAGRPSPRKLRSGSSAAAAEANSEVSGNRRDPWTPRYHLYLFARRLAQLLPITQAEFGWIQRSRSRPSPLVIVASFFSPNLHWRGAKQRTFRAIDTTPWEAR